jgi:hypothetical protein
LFMILLENIVVQQFLKKVLWIKKQLVLIDFLHIPKTLNKEPV